MHPHPNNLALLICCFMAGFLEAGCGGSAWGGGVYRKAGGLGTILFRLPQFAQRCLLAQRTGSVFCILANHLSCSHSDGLPFLGFNHLPVIPTSVCSALIVSALPFSVSTSLLSYFLFNFWALKTVQPPPKHLRLFNIFLWP